MSHTPEWPQLYVCEECNAVYAGDFERTNGEHDYYEPDDCAACGADEFEAIEDYVTH